MLIMNFRLNKYTGLEVMPVVFFVFFEKIKYKFLPLITTFLSSDCRERRKDQTNKIQEDLTAERTVENKLM